VPGEEVRALLRAPVVDGPALLRAIGIAQPASTLVTSPEAAREAVAALPGPGVLKLSAGELAHKSDVGGVPRRPRGSSPSCWTPRSATTCPTSRACWCRNSSLRAPS
jgi:hypothetical protein